MAKFNLMSYIMPPENKLFFTYFQDSTNICSQAARLYEQIMEKHLTESDKEEALKYKKKSKISYQAVLKQLNKSFITPIEREDIQTIALQLNKITKKITKACLNIELYRLESYTDEMKEQAFTLVKATEKLQEIMSNFKKVSDEAQMTKLSIEMKEFEAHGDEVIRNAMNQLFSGKYEALEVIKLRDIYKEVENALDACFYVSDTILNVVLKQN